MLTHEKVVLLYFCCKLLSKPNCEIQPVSHMIYVYMYKHAFHVNNKINQFYIAKKLYFVFSWPIQENKGGTPTDHFGIILHYLTSVNVKHTIEAKGKKLSD